jgi:modulator of FtsH protease
MAAWANFLTAQVGASAALVGLLFVGLSVNLSKILASAKLTDRAFVVFLLLLTVLVASSLCSRQGSQQASADQ